MFRELETRQRKFESEAREQRRKEKEKAGRIEKERLAAEKRQKEREDRKKEQRRLEEQKLQEEETRKERLREVNRGVFLEDVLSPLPLPSDSAVKAGIRRWKDKVVLPAYMEDNLMKQEAYRNGALLFRLEAENGRHTHVGVLKFSADAGTVQLPSHVMRCLWGEEDTCEGRIKVTYKRLPEGTFARLQPLKRGFHEAVGEAMKDILEDTLSQQSTLTEGDIFHVSLGTNDSVHQLKVVELSPASAVSIVHTDLEVDVLPSAEVEDAVREKLEAAQQMSFTKPDRPKYRVAKQEAETSGMPFEQDPLQTTVAPQLERTVSAELGPEVPEEAEDAIVCSVRFPNGTSANRRFRLDDSLSSLFHFVDVKSASQELSANYKLVTRFPRCVISQQEHAMNTFRHHGFERQQVFFIDSQ